MLKPERGEILIGGSQYSSSYLYKWLIERKEGKIIFSTTYIDEERGHIDKFDGTFSEKDWCQGVKKFIKEQKAVVIIGKTKIFPTFLNEPEERKVKIEFSLYGEIIELSYLGPYGCLVIGLSQKDLKELIPKNKEKK